MRIAKAVAAFVVTAVLLYLEEKQFIDDATRFKIEDLVASLIAGGIVWAVPNKPSS